MHTRACVSAYTHAQAGGWVGAALLCWGSCGREETMEQLSCPARCTPAVHSYLHTHFLGY